MIAAIGVIAALAMVVAFGAWIIVAIAFYEWRRSLGVTGAKPLGLFNPDLSINRLLIFDPEYQPEEGEEARHFRRLRVAARLCAGSLIIFGVALLMLIWLTRGPG